MMTRLTAILVMIVMASPALGGALAIRTLPAGTIVSADDFSLSNENEAMPGSSGEIIGMQTKTIIYAGRAITPDLLREPTMVERNQIVVLLYESGPLVIQAEGRALAAGAEGDVVGVMNLGSRTTVQATVRGDGLLSVATR